MEIRDTVISRKTGTPAEVIYRDIESEQDFEGKEIEGARAYCFCGDKLVLVHEAKGHWNLPGGGIEEGEDVRSGIQREVKEETNMTVTQMKLIGLHEVRWDDGTKYYIHAACLVEPDGAFTADPAGEVTEIRLIDPNDCFKMIDAGPSQISDWVYKRALELKKEMQSRVDFVNGISV